MGLLLPSRQFHGYRAVKLRAKFGVYRLCFTDGHLKWGEGVGVVGGGSHSLADNSLLFLLYIPVFLSFSFVFIFFFYVDGDGGFCFACHWFNEYFHSNYLSFFFLKVFVSFWFYDDDADGFLGGRLSINSHQYATYIQLIHRDYNYDGKKDKKWPINELCLNCLNPIDELCLRCL